MSGGSAVTVEWGRSAAMEARANRRPRLRSRPALPPARPCCQPSHTLSPPSLHSNTRPVTSQRPCPDTPPAARRWPGPWDPSPRGPRRRRTPRPSPGCGRRGRSRLGLRGESEDLGGFRAFKDSASCFESLLLVARDDGRLHGFSETGVGDLNGEIYFAPKASLAQCEAGEPQSGGVAVRIDRRLNDRLAAGLEAVLDFRPFQQSELLISPARHRSEHEGVIVATVDRGGGARRRWRHGPGRPTAPTILS